MCLLTAAAGSDLAAGTVTWLSQASFTPLLVMAEIKRDGHVHAVLGRSRAFAVNIGAITPSLSRGWSRAGCATPRRNR